MFELLEPQVSYIADGDFFDKIAAVAHNCYQVKDKDHKSNVEFVMRLVQNGHLAMLEHYRFLIKVDDIRPFKEEGNHYYDLFQHSDCSLVSCNIRTILEGLKSDDKLRRENAMTLYSALDLEIREAFNLPNIEPEAELVKNPESMLSSEELSLATYISYKIITDRGVTHELVRHRPCSFAQESTRYCNYTKDKFSNCLTFIRPDAYLENKETYDKFFSSCSDAYFALIANGCKPDEARSVLPNALKASIIVTCSLTEWKNIFTLRLDSHAHPGIRKVMGMVKEDMIKRRILEDGD